MPTDAATPGRPAFASPEEATIKRKRDDPPIQSERWNAKYPKHSGPKITLESIDGCLFRVTRKLLSSQSMVFRTMFNIATDCDTPIPIDLAEGDLRVLLDILRDARVERGELSKLSISSLGALRGAVDKYEIDSLKVSLEVEVHRRLETAPLDMFSLASDLDDLPLAKKAVDKMTRSKLTSQFATVKDIFTFAQRLRLDWQLPFLQLLFCGPLPPQTSFILDYTITTRSGALRSKDFDPNTGPTNPSSASSAPKAGRSNSTQATSYDPSHFDVGEDASWGELDWHRFS